MTPQPPPAVGLLVRVLFDAIRAVIAIKIRRPGSLPIYWACLLPALLCVSCATLHPSYNDDVLDHAIVMRGSGTWDDPRSKLVTQTGPLPDDHMEIYPQLARIRQKIDDLSKTSAQPLKILVFVHGGLHTFEQSAELYGQLRKPMDDAGYYPIFIIWDSNFLSSYRDRLFLVRQGEEHPLTAKLTSPIVLPIDLITSVIRFPMVWTSELGTDYQTIELRNSPQRRDHDGIEDFLGEKLRKTDSIRLGTEGRGGWERFYYGLSYAVTWPTKLATSPIIDGLGSKAWDIMMRRTESMFHPPEGVDVLEKLNRRGAWTRVWPASEDSPTDAQNRRDVIEAWYNNGSPNPTNDQKHNAPGTMFAFTRALSEWSNHLNVEVHLFGHSMGTIVVNQMLRQEPELKLKRIGYLAGACSIRDWQTAVPPYLQAHEDTEFYAVSLHRMREQSERNPLNTDLTPRGSLLNWLDNFLTNPVTIADRTFGSWDNVVRMMPQIAANANAMPTAPTRKKPIMAQMHFHSLDAIDLFDRTKRDTQPQKHGDFSEWKFWYDDFLWPDGNKLIPTNLKADAPKMKEPMPPMRF